MPATYDVLAFRPVGSRETGSKLAASLVDALSSGAAATGMLKLAQRWALEFMTETGSIPYQTARGCEFSRKVRMGKIRTDLDLAQAFAISSAKVRQSLRSEETDEDPPDEKFASAHLVSSSVTGGTLTLSVLIQNLAQERIKIGLSIRLEA